MYRVVFLDRDGVINIEKNYLYKIEDFEWITGVKESVRAFNEAGYKVIVVTNHSGIGRGYYTQDDFDRLTVWMKEEFHKAGGEILALYHCPHAPHEACQCRKPLAGMIIQACQDYPIDLTQSWLIGDKESDIQAALAGGVAGTILVRSGHDVDEKSTQAQWVVNGIFDTISLICSKDKE